MVSNKELDLRNMDSIHDFFQLIIDNENNGNRHTVRKFIKQLSKDQKLDFNNWINDSHLNNTEKHDFKNILIRMCL